MDTPGLDRIEAIFRKRREIRLTPDEFDAALAEMQKFHYDSLFSADDIPEPNFCYFGGFLIRDEGKS